MKYLKQSAFVIGFVFLTIFLQTVSLDNTNEVANADTECPDNQLCGFARSENIGWISFNDNPDDLGDIEYKVELVNENLVGKAWSDNIGWIRFGDLDEDLGYDNASVDDEGDFHGFAIACAVFVGDCEGDLDPERGNWDGLISFEGEALNGTDYGVSVDLDDGDVTGHAWGSDVIGWIDMNDLVLNIELTPDCSNGENDDGDDWTDLDDAGCMNNPLGESEVTQCQDGVDNWDREDEDADDADLGCRGEDDYRQDISEANGAGEIGVDIKVGVDKPASDDKGFIIDARKTGTVLNFSVEVDGGAYDVICEYKIGENGKGINSWTSKSTTYSPIIDSETGALIEPAGFSDSFNINVSEANEVMQGKPFETRTFVLTCNDPTTGDEGMDSVKITGKSETEI